ncbi:HD domain-containing phosphohydrolase [Clostridium sp. AM58-1XD]|uniref:HD-GYP domain-containing protein n=1 Tax=Clostridium sp. AM58-1XD TaxID=2292307 RepID=UPI001FA8A63D|nr:HD domain-containing phosphohydrolase [Clostridium sp. AM58-1XD]
MRTHVDICEKIFGGEIEETIERIALRHHEKMNGSGYPKGLCAADLTIPERIVAVADIISALAGTRSYKEAYGKDRIISILTDMIRNNLIDADITGTAISHYDEIMEITRIRCSPLISIYHGIQDEYQALMQASSASQRIRMAWERSFSQPDFMPAEGSSPTVLHR